MRIELTTTPSEEDAQAVSQGLMSFNHEAVEDLEPIESIIKFSVFARDDEGDVVGGLRAMCFWNTLHIELLWLPEKARGNGTGSALLAEAERFAADNGYELALLETTSWQAKPFYEKLGYELMATLPQYPKSHATHFMSKRLSPTQGTSVHVPDS